MKGIIVVDIPRKCKHCKFYYYARDAHTGKYAGGCRITSTMSIKDSDKIQDWCPIKNMPSKIRGITEHDKGWNDCIEQILKGE